MEIKIENRLDAGAVDVARLERGLLEVLKRLSCAADAELSVVLTDNQDIAALNERYLGRKGPTNVLAFPMGEGDFKELNSGLLGDVVVSVEYAGQEAEENGLDPQEHVARLLIHGVLHLLGYDHIGDESEARKMEDLTEDLLLIFASQAKGE